MERVKETARDLPVTYASEVVIAGAGPAGVMAAIAAARAGADTLLLERANCAGGIWTCGLLSWMLDVANKRGILRELMNRIESEKEGYFARGGNFIAFPEMVKRVLDDMLAESGVRVLYHTQVVGAVTDKRRITHVIIESKAGRAAVKGRVFIDATGDGDLSALAGCRFEIGKTGTGETQPVSMIAMMTGVREEEAHAFNNTVPYGDGENAKQRLMREMQRAGITPSYITPSFFHIAEDIWLVMTTHGYAVDALDPQSLTCATIEGRRELHAQKQALRKLGEPWCKLRMVATAPYIGVRECRRINGKYTVTLDDALTGRTHDDAVCRVCFSLDVHPLRMGRTTEMEHAQAKLDGVSGEHLRTKPYDIPLRALEAADMDNLLLAGRLISGDFFAHSSYRVTGDAATLGETAGIEAARRMSNEVEART